MKLSLIFFVAFSTMSFASNAQKISLNLKNSTLNNALSIIEKQSNYSFAYEKKLLKNTKKISISLINKSIEESLDLLFKDEAILYKIHQNYIVLSSRGVNPPKIKDEIRFVEEPENRAKIQQKITGSIIDSLGNKISGASVANLSNNIKVSSDAEGKFTIAGKVGDELRISFVGYNTITITVANLERNEVILSVANSDMEEVVVTALGIKKESRSLVYNVQELKGEELTRNKDANFVNALTGKVAGITINSSSSGIGGATRVIMRGVKSISGNNNALYVVDGIPIPNSNGGGVSGPFAGAVSGEGISSINPEDIESISALTGPSATALYGNQGANGVIVVTTKKGNVGKLQINLSHSSDFFSPFVMPKFQNTYGQIDGAMSSWGRKLKQPSDYRPRDFFQTGSNIFNALSLSGGNEKSQTFFSLSSNNSDGIIRKNEFNRYNAYLRHTTQMTEKFTMDFGAMYAKIDNNNMIAQGQYHNPIVPVYLFPPGDDFEKFKVFKRYDPDRKIPEQFWPYSNQGLSLQNPYWITDAQSRTNKIDRYMLNASTKYVLTDWLNIVARARIDNSFTWSEDKRPATTDGLFASEYGFYSTGKLFSKNTYVDLIASIKKNINENLGFLSNFGGSYQDDHSDGIYSGGNLVRLANFHSVGENTINVPSQSYSHTQLQSVFGTADFDYKNMLFLSFTGRNEWSSRLSMANVKSYFYPSAGLSAVITDLFSIPKSILSFGKLRFSYAEVGNAPNLEDPAFSLINPLATRIAPFPEFQVERTKSYEAGMELKFFNNQLSLNATVYKSNTINQLLFQPTVGIYNVFHVNAGDIQNKGIEGSIGYNSHIGDFMWSTNAVFSLNRNKIIHLAEGSLNKLTNETFGIDDINMGGIGDLQNILRLGGTTQDLYITQALREDNQGNLYVHPVSSNIEKVSIPQTFIGRATPDYNLGWRNQFSYKNFDLGFLIDARVGGIGISYTQGVMDAFGVSEQSALDRENGGVYVYGKLYTDIEKYYNTIGATSGGSAGLSRHYIYDATNVRLREASFGYTLKSKILYGKIDNIKFSLIGRNIFMFYNKSPFDPESTSSTGTYGQGVDYFRQPSYRSLGFSVSVKF